jgi:glycosyltransferase involved in cell wall biosynthesis
MNPLLSIIIPMYNVEKYIEKCLDSVYELEADSSQYEIVLIDDESPDNSLVIAKSIVEKKSNAKIISQKNKGLGGARNTGILNASGMYVMFLDSDDFISNKKLLDVVNIAVKNDVDVLEFAANRVDNKYNYIDTIFQIDTISVVTGNEYIENFEFGNSACNKFYNRNFLISNNISFVEKTYVEDAPFNVEVFVNAKKVLAIPSVLVSFFQNSSSITRTKRKGDVLNKYILDAIKVTTIMNNLILKSNLSKKASKKLMVKVALFTSGLLLMVLKSNKSFSEKKQILESLIAQDLYPIKSKTYIFNRDLFINVVNRKFALNNLMFFSSLIFKK